MQTLTALATFVLAAGTGCGATSSDPIDPAAAPLGTLVIVEVDPAGDPHDWFVVVNADDRPVVLSDYLFVDRAGDLERARAFPEDIVLAPGETHRQECSEVRAGFSLGRDEGLWIYRADGAPSDSVDWDASAPGSVVAMRPGLPQHVEQLIVHHRQVADRRDGRAGRDQMHD